jgi:hypothetical protein
MNQKLLSMLNDAEQELVREAGSDALSKLDEDELLELHTRVRRARNKYSKLYRRRAGERVEADSSRSRASAANARTRVKAEIFEDVLADVSRRLAAVAKDRASELRAERLAAARREDSASKARSSTSTSRSSGRPKSSGRAKSTGKDTLRSPASKKKAASTRAAGKRGQAKRDSRG